LKQKATFRSGVIQGLSSANSRNKSVKPTKVN